MRRWRGRSDPLPGRGSNDTHLTVAQDLCQKLCVSDLIVSESSVFCLFVTCLYWNQVLCFKIIDNKTLTININWKKLVIWCGSYTLKALKLCVSGKWTSSGIFIIQILISIVFHILYFFSSIFNTLKKKQALKIQKQNYVTYSLINFQVMLWELQSSVHLCQLQ